mgnify:CR=1 FL=1
MKNILIIDSAYTLKFIKDRKLENFIISRDNEKYFDHVWTTHPVDNIFEKIQKTNDYGKITLHKINERHSYIRGKIGKFYFLRKINTINFIISQINLILYLKKLIKKNNIKLIRSEDALYNGLLAYILAKIIYKKKLIICVFGNPDEIRKNNKKPLMPKLFKFIFIEKIIEKFILKKADMIIVQNEDNKNFVHSKNINKNKIKVFRIGRDIHPSHYLDPNLRNHKIISKDFEITNKKIVTFVSRLVKLKLPDHFIKVVDYLKNNDVQVSAFVVGEGELKEDLINDCKRRDLINEINFVGAKDQEWLASLLALTDIFVCPLKGRALVEAALGSCPVIAYDIDWHSEIIENYKNGVIVDFMDINKLSSESLKLIKNEKLSNEYGNNLRKKILKYSNKEELIKYENLCYDELL